MQLIFAIVNVSIPKTRKLENYSLKCILFNEQMHLVGQYLQQNFCQKEYQNIKLMLSSYSQMCFDVG